MKLISCHIEGFGIFVNKDFDFSAPLSCYYEKNGFGKTTLAAFITAAFYGMETARENQKNNKFSDREHYKPFGGGAYGGYVKFEWRNAEYTVEKQFDEKTETKDKCVIYRNGVDCTKSFDGAQIGEIIFNINKETFKKTILIDYQSLDATADDGVHKLILGDDNSGEADKSVSEAIKIIEKKRDEYDRKSGRGDCKAERCSNKIKGLQDEIRTLEDDIALLSEKYKQLEVLEKEGEDLSKKKQELDGVETQLAKWKNYEDYIEEKKHNESTVEDLRNKYRYGFPTYTEIEQVSNATSEIRTQNGLIKGAEQNEEAKRNFEELNKVFASGIPSEEISQRVRNDISALSEAERQLKENIQSQNKDNETLNKSFVNGVPTDKELNKLFEDYNRYKDLNKQIIDIKYAENVRLNEAKKPDKKFVACLLVCVILTIVGGLSFIFNLLIGAIITSVGVVGLTVDLILFLRSHSVISISQTNASVEEKTNSANAVRSTIEDTLKRYGFYGDESIELCLHKLNESVKEYESLSQCVNKRAEDIAVLQKDIESKKDSLKKFFFAYGLSGDDYEQLNGELQTKITKYQVMLDSKEQSEKTIKDANDKKSECQRVIRGFFDKYEITMPQTPNEVTGKLNDVKGDLNSLQKAEKDAKFYTDKAENFKAENKLTVKPQCIDDAYRKEIFSKLKESDEKIANLKSDIADTERNKEKSAVLKQQLEECSEELKEYKEKAKTYQTAIDKINQAYENIRERLLKPTNETFAKYSDVLEKTIGVKVRINGDFNVVFDKNGAQRRMEFLSIGQRTICAVCYRLALIENMYKTELPFIILDDPFVNLDEENMVCAQRFLKEISNRFGVVYLCCHKSRVI